MALQNVHQQRALSFHLQPHELFTLERAQHIRKAPHADGALGKIRVFVGDGAFKDGGIDALKAFVLVLAQVFFENAHEIVARECLGMGGVFLVAKLHDDIEVIVDHLQRAVMLRKAREQLAEAGKAQ